MLKFGPKIFTMKILKGKFKGQKFNKLWLLKASLYSGRICTNLEHIV